jgi:hypothetical protein
MGGLKSIVFTVLLAAAVGVGVIAVIAHFIEPGGSMFGSVRPLAGGAIAGAGAADVSPGDAAANGTVVKQASLPLQDGVTLEALIVLGPRATTAGGAEQRLLVAHFDFRKAGFSLQSAYLHATVPAGDRGRRGTGTEFDTHLAGRSAATLLGASAEVAAPYAEPAKSPFYSCNLDPRSGLTWGEIASEGDLALTVSQEP